MSQNGGGASTQAAKIVLEEALGSNLRLQADLIARLEKVAILKAENRRAAFGAAEALRRRWEAEGYDERSARTFRPLDGPSLRRLVERERRRREDERISRGGRGECNEASYPPLSSVQMIRRWAYSDDRKWKRRYFVDPDGSVPDPNVDAARKKEVEANIPFFHRCPPWSNIELERLREAAEKVRQEQISEKKSVGKGEEETKSGEGGAVEATMKDADIDFNRVASLLNECIPPKNMDVVVRSAAECRSKYLTTASPSIYNAKFTRDESLHIAELVRRHGGHPPWNAVAASLGTGRTPWQCFRRHRCDLDSSSSSSRPWTPEEDELLLKYVAAHGPAFLFNQMGAVADVAARFFPDRNPKQVMWRAHASLLNPNLKNETWSEEEERRLALCMRIYRDAQSPLVRAYAHFPDRSSKSVSEKWLRSLNPETTFKPFTRKEDRDLLQAIEKMGGPNACSWVQLARQHFPSRNPRTLKYRWMELASDEDLLTKYGDQMERGRGQNDYGAVGKAPLAHSDLSAGKSWKSRKDLKGQESDGANLSSRKQLRSLKLGCKRKRTKQHE